MAPMSAIGTKVASRVGRAQTMVGLKVVGVSLLIIMTVLADRWFSDMSSADDDAEATLKAVVVVSIYLIRTGLSNVAKHAR